MVTMVQGEMESLSTIQEVSTIHVLCYLGSEAPFHAEGLLTLSGES